MSVTVFIERVRLRWPFCCCCNSAAVRLYFRYARVFFVGAVSCKSSEQACRGSGVGVVAQDFCFNFVSAAHGD